MRRPPPPHRRGEPRTPGSGRKRGTPNRRTVELRNLFAALIGDVDYQRRLREAFTTRRLHPSTEQKVWEYTIGTPKQQVDMSAQVSLDAKLASEREALRSLNLAELEELAAESQRLIDRAVAMAKASATDAIGTAAVSITSNTDTVDPDTNR